MLAKLDGLGLNYNTAASVDALHARYPHLFLFESESSSETSTRGTYQEPQHLNTGENHTPGRRATSSFDNNLASWTMSGEYGLKKDRDRAFFAGEFLWSGTDYIGEPTPYGVFPVKASFFGAVDTAGFPKDMYHLFRSQWTSEPMVHLLPMDWTDHRPGETVEVWAYSTVDTVELYLNGRSLGVRRFDTKKTVDGRTYLETTEPTGDDKTVTTGAYPGSYTSPNGSAGKLHLTWQVPFAAGELKAVARRNGKVVATDVLRTAGEPHAVRLTPDRASAVADGDSLVYVTAEVIDSHGVVVPGADHLLTFTVSGGSLAGLDNGQQESAERYQATTRTAFHGKALAIVRSGTSAGHLDVTASAPACTAAPPRCAARARPARWPALPGALRPGPRPRHAVLPAGRRELLRLALLAAGRDARRRPGHRLVQRLRQERHRAAARVQRCPPRGLGLGHLGHRPPRRHRLRLLHRGRDAHVAGHGHGVVLGRRPLGPGAAPGRLLGERERQPHGRLLHRRRQRAAAAGPDQRGPRHARRRAAHQRADRHGGGRMSR